MYRSTDHQPNEPYAETIGLDFIMINENNPKNSILKKPKEDLKSYDRKFKEDITTEDIKLAIFRRKRITELSSKARHLFIFSDINTNVYNNISYNDYAKAWSVLYTFRNKSLESALYDEVECIVSRNTSNKRFAHKLYNEFMNESKNVTQLRNYTSKLFTT